MVPPAARGESATGGVQAADSGLCDQRTRLGQHLLLVSGLSNAPLGVMGLPVSTAIDAA